VTPERVNAQFRLPDLSRLLPATLHPQAQKIHEATHQWVRDRLRPYFTDEITFTHFVEHHVDLWGLLCTPSGRAERVQSICQSHYLIMMIDDQFARPTPGSAHGREAAWYGRTAELAWIVAEKFGAILKGEPADPETPLTGVFEEVWHSLTQHMAPELRNRLRTTLTEFIVGCAADIGPAPAGTSADFEVSEQASVAPSTETSDLEEWLRFRGYTIGARYNHVLLEHALDVDMTEPFEQEPTLLRAAELVARHQFLMNDLFSYRKEILAGQEHSNTLAVIQRLEGVDLQQAVDRLCDLAEQIERQYAHARQEIQAGSLKGRRDVARYLDEMWHMITGNIEYSLMTPRYNGIGHHWNGLTAGQVTLTPARTIYQPDPTRPTRAWTTATRPRWMDFVTISSSTSAAEAEREEECVR
jgi:hypothetical protein